VLLTLLDHLLRLLQQPIYAEWLIEGWDAKWHTLGCWPVASQQVDDGQFAIKLPQLFCEMCPDHPRHSAVSDDQVKRVNGGAKGLKPSDTITGLLYLETAVSERTGKESTDHLVIIYQEDAITHLGLS